MIRYKSIKTSVRAVIQPTRDSILDKENKKKRHRAINIKTFSLQKRLTNKTINLVFQKNININDNERQF